MLENDGIPASQVAREVAEALIAAPLLLSDQAGLEDFWLRCLMMALPRSDWPAIRVHSLRQYLGKLLGEQPTKAWTDLAPLREQISVTKPLTHRAGADVAHYVELIRRVLRHADLE